VDFSRSNGAGSLAPQQASNRAFVNHTEALVKVKGVPNGVTTIS
jgi:hypothetical protein